MNNKGPLQQENIIHLFMKAICGMLALFYWLKSPCTKIIIFDQLAATDEFGNKYSKPLLQSLLGKPNVTYIGNCS